MSYRTSAPRSFGISLLLLGLHCRGGDPQAAVPSVLVPDPEGCRSFVASGQVLVEGRAGEQRCQFDAASAEHRCDIAAGQARRSTVTEYESLADFVEAGRHVGKITSLGATSIDDGRQRRVRYFYDELGRLVRRVEETPSQTLVTRYTDHDGAGRPRRGALDPLGSAAGACDGWLVAIEYSDAARTVQERAVRRHPERCGFAERIRLERYDAAGNPVSIDAASGAGVARLFAAGGAARTQRVCL